MDVDELEEICRGESLGVAIFSLYTRERTIMMTMHCFSTERLFAVGLLPTRTVYAFLLSQYHKAILGALRHVGCKSLTL